MSENQERNKRRRIERLIARNNKKNTFRVTHLPDDLLKRCFSFIGPGNYRFVAGTCRCFQATYPFPKKTTWKTAAASVPCAELCQKDIASMKSGGRYTYYLYKKDIARGAASIGQMKVIEWVHDGHSDAIGKRVFVSAGAAGHLNVIEWGESKGIDWDSFELRRKMAEDGHLQICEWIYRRNRSSRGFSRGAALGGHIHVLKWMKEHDLLPLDDCSAWDAAAKSEHFHVLTWLQENGFTQIRSAVHSAAQGGHVGVLLWCRGQGCEWDEKTCAQAAQGGHLDTLKWLREQGAPWDSDTIGEAENWGHTRVAEWARANGCPEPEPPVDYDSYEYSD